MNVTQIIILLTQMSLMSNNRRTKTITRKIKITNYKMEKTDNVH